MSFTPANITDGEFEWEVTHLSLVPYPAFMPTIAVLVGLALVCFVGRLAIRLATRRRLYLDDYFLCLAAASLCVSTALVVRYKFLWDLINAAYRAPDLTWTTPILKSADDLYDSTKVRKSSAVVKSFVVMTWTTIFSVKFCFFAFLKPLIRHLYGLTIYYWVAVVFTALGYGLCCSEAFVFDVYNNTQREVVLTAWNSLSLKYTILMTGADVISDVMIVSIPILLLRKSRLKRSNKLSIGFFLCLSIFMAICCIVRASANVLGSNHIPDLLWRTFWQVIEGCVAVIMASITVFRSLFTTGNESPQAKPETPSGKPKYLTGILPRLLSRKKIANSGKISGSDETGTKSGEYIELPPMPSATFTGIRSFIRRNHRTGPASTFAESELDPMEADYHANIRAHL